MLSLELGTTVAELSERISAAELAHWIALYKQQPWGYERTDLMLAQIAQLIYNSNSKCPRKLHEFLLFNDRAADKPGDDAKTIRRNFEQLIARQGKRRN